MVTNNRQVLLNGYLPVLGGSFLFARTSGSGHENQTWF
jgi:hypothetical protein